MEERWLSISWKILMVPHVVVGLIGLVWLLAPAMTVGADIQSYVGQPWPDFVAANPTVSAYVALLGGTTGVQLIVISVLTTAATPTAYRRGEKWAWYAFLVGNTLGWGSGLVHEAAAGAIPIAILTAVMLVAAYVGLGFGAKAVLGKATS